MRTRAEGNIGLRILPLLLFLLLALPQPGNCQRQFLIKGLSQYEKEKGLDQYDLDYGLDLGGSNYLGEIGGEEKTRRDWVLDLKPIHTSFALGAFCRYKVIPSFSVTLNFMYGRIRGADSNSTNPARVARNLSFRNDIKELSLQLEYTFFSYFGVGTPERYSLNLRAYAFLGAAGYHHSPKAYHEGSWQALRPLKTEGQSTPYPSFGFSIPKGIGFHYTYEREYRIGLKIGWRTTFTDYLDDISTTYPESPPELSNRTHEIRNRGDLPSPENYGPGDKRGDPTHDDSYLFFTVTISKVIKSQALMRKIKSIGKKNTNSKVRQPLEDIER